MRSYILIILLPLALIACGGGSQNNNKTHQPALGETQEDSVISQDANDKGETGNIDEPADNVDTEESLIPTENFPTPTNLVAYVQELYELEAFPTYGLFSNGGLRYSGTFYDAANSIYTIGTSVKNHDGTTDYYSLTSNKESGTSEGNVTYSDSSVKQLSITYQEKKDANNKAYVHIQKQLWSKLGEATTVHEYESIDAFFYPLLGIKFNHRKVQKNNGSGTLVDYGEIIISRDENGLATQKTYRGQLIDEVLLKNQYGDLFDLKLKISNNPENGEQNIFDAHLEYTVNYEWDGTYNRATHNIEVPNNIENLEEYSLVETFRFFENSSQSIAFQENITTLIDGQAVTNRKDIFINKNFKNLKPYALLTSYNTGRLKGGTYESLDNELLSTVVFWSDD